MRTKGKHARGAALKRITPDLARRAGGRWLTWDAWPHSVECRCEICGAFVGDVMGHRAHIDERKSEKDDTIENIIVACNECHDHTRFGDGGLVCGTEPAKAIVKALNEVMA